MTDFQLSAVCVLVGILASVRITQAIAHDDIGTPIRIWLLRAIKRRTKRAVNPWPEWVENGPHCPWCVGFWVSLAMCLVALVSVGSIYNPGDRFPAGVYLVLFTPWAVAWIVSYLASRE